jgi:hypothetical protein
VQTMKWEQPGTFVVNVMIQANILFMDYIGPDPIIRWSRFCSCKIGSSILFVDGQIGIYSVNILDNIQLTHSILS